MALNLLKTHIHYCYNNLFSVEKCKYLSLQKGYHSLKNAHRIDKNTSGVCIFYKGEVDSKVKEMFFAGLESNARFSKKEYIALVDGEFPGKNTELLG